MNQNYKNNFITAGKIAKEVRAYGASLIQPGASYNEVIAKIKEKIAALGAIPAFPPQIAMNEIAAHYLPMPETDIIFSDELIKLDVGICYKGAIGDCAVSLDLSGKYALLIEATEKALFAAEQIIEVGLPIGEIGAIIDHTITQAGFEPVRNLSGHGLGCFKVHTPPCIPNYDNRSKTPLKPGMTFAIEPFATNGIGSVYEEGAPTIFSFLKERKPRSELAFSLLTKIRQFEGLPFSTHDLVSESLELEKLYKGLDELMRKGIITGYPPLIEEKMGFVTQAENSVLIDEEGKVTITTR